MELIGLLWGLMIIGMAVMTRDRKPPALPSFDYRTDPRYQDAHAKLSDLRRRQHQLESGADTQAGEIAGVVKELEALETSRILGDATDADLETLRDKRRQLEDARRDLLTEAPGLVRAIEEQERRLQALEGDIQQELRPQLEPALQAASEDLARVLRVAADANERVRTIVAQAGRWARLPVSFVPSLVLVDSDRGDVYLKHQNGQSEVSRWFRDARAAGYDVGAPQE